MGVQHVDVDDSGFRKICGRPNKGEGSCQPPPSTGTSQEAGIYQRITANQAAMAGGWCMDFAPLGKL